MSCRVSYETLDCAIEFRVRIEVTVVEQFCPLINSSLLMRVDAWRISRQVAQNNTWMLRKPSRQHLKLFTT